MLEKDGASVGVVEHLMAALAGAGIDDLTVSLDGPEPPILDGDALSYLTLIQKAGLKSQNVPREAIEVLKPVRVSHKDASASLTPAAATAYAFEIAFSAAAIGRQTLRWNFPRHLRGPDRPRPHLRVPWGIGKPSRDEFGARRLAGKHPWRLTTRAWSTRPDALSRRVCTPQDLDAIGDIGAGARPLKARFHGVRSGHATNNALLRALFSDPDAFRRVPFPPVHAIRRLRARTRAARNGIRPCPS